MSCKVWKVREKELGAAVPLSLVLTLLQLLVTVDRTATQVCSTAAGGPGGPGGPGLVVGRISDCEPAATVEREKDTGEGLRCEAEEDI